MRKDFTKEDPEIKNILGEIQKLSKFKDLDTKKYTEEGGYADTLAGKLRKMKTAQLRKFFGEIKIIEKRIDGGESWKDVELKFYQLMPRLAYAKGRNLIPEEFYTVLKTAFKKVDIGKEDIDKKENFKVLVNFLEAVIAYHKFHGGD